MPQVTFTKEDLLSRNQLPAGWYPLKLKSCTEEPAKSDGSTNWVCQFTVCDGPQAGTPIRHWFNEKYMGGVVNFFDCFSKSEVGKSYKFEDAIERPVLGYCKFDTTRKNNVIEDFKAAK